MKKSVLVFLLLFGLTLFFFHKLIFSFGQIIYPAPDIFYVTFLEKMLFSYDITTYKSLPFWNPYVFSGSPFLGNPTSTMFYPFNLLFLIFPIGSTFGYVFAIDSFLIGIFTYLFARTIKINRFGSLISAITIMFSGPMIGSVFAGHPILSDTFIWFPLALLFFELMIVKRKVIFAIMAAFTIALMFFAGAPQTAVYEIFSLLIYFILRSTSSVKSIRDFFKLSILPIIAVSTGILIAAIQLFPSFEFSRLSQRGSSGISYTFASDFSLHPYQILSFIFPYFFGSPVNQTYWGKGNFWELNGYIGILPLIFTAFAVLTKKNKYVLIFLIIGLFAILHALGKYSYVFPFFFNYVPGFNNFRVPSRFLFIYVFSFSILSGIGASFLVDSLKKFKFLYQKGLFSVSVIILFIICFLFFIETDNLIVSTYERYVLRNSFAVGINHSLLYVQTRNDILFFLASLLFLYIIVVLKKRNILNTYQLKSLVVFFIFFDLYVFGSRLVDTRSVQEAFKPTPIINQILEDKSVYRVFDMKGEHTSLIASNNLESITGVHSLYLKDTRDFLWSIGKYVNMPYDSFIGIDEISKPIFLNLLNVKYIIANHKAQVDGLSEIMKSNSRPSYFSVPNQTYYLYKNTKVLPRAFIVPNGLIIKDKQKTISFIAGNNFDPKKYVILEKEPENTKLNNFSIFKEVSIERENFNKISLNVNLDNSGFMVLSEVYYPGWKAYDNGKEIEIFKANYILRALFLDKGRHQVTFVYDPDSYKIGLTISLVTLFLSFLYIIIFVKKSRRLINKA